jgi:hypothetical protein
MSEPARRPLVLLGLQGLGHLRLEHFLHHRLQQRPKSVLIAGQYRFPVQLSRRSLVLGHGVFPFHGVGDVEHHHHAMAAAALNAFAEPSAHYPSSHAGQHSVGGTGP